MQQKEIYKLKTVVKNEAYNSKSRLQVVNCKKDYIL